ncbi:DNA-binding protein WhiA [Eubacterium aggregans]|uniref:DNA-binding protein WhiA n=1 Tax=Eubacterium aggregans TaxID=81409 RepID=UPI003F3CA68B
MSFSQQVKKDLCAQPFEADGCVRAELSGLLAPVAVVAVDAALVPQVISVQTENPEVAGRIFRMVKLLYGIIPSVKILKHKHFKNHRLYEVTIMGDVVRVLKDLRILHHNAKHQNFYVNEIPPFFSSKQRFIKSYIRGVFLCCGSVSDPEKGYRLELAVKQKDYLKSLAQVLSHYEIKTNLITRKASEVLYVKEAESVSSFLGLIGAHKALLDVESIRVMKEVRSYVNRKVNCDVANLNKVSAAAEKQLADIQAIARGPGLSSLPPSLRHLAELREENPDASLKELGEMMTPPVGKSGVYHRLSKMAKIAAEL